MPSSLMTKKIMADALKTLMKTTPFTKISIGDIVGQCGMNRNSFYYHFRDKYELLNWIFLTEITAEISSDEAEELSSWELVSRISRLFYDNKSFYINAMSFDGQDSFREYFSEVIAALLEARSEDMFETDEYQQFFVDFFVDAIVCSFSRWLSGGAKQPPDKFTDMLKKAMTGAAVQILDERMSENTPGII